MRATPTSSMCETLNPKQYALHPAPCTLHPTPYASTLL
eukprot:CAMPEP_0182899960 /NCGR_PEP_ID=MMETSP0034_2-20130328/28448_1 /TAXON_ID=156128 /ORGANISM="Nephroselmis pyriformis, Strain CCMP717" /LENGTH=37 /DNA_ID= /DNA_START= /DNA_END= /DNA_ORIENTATION=